VNAAQSALLTSAAALLDQGSGLDRLSRLLTAVALAALVALGFVGAQRPVAAVLLGLSVLAGVVQVGLAVRTGLDAVLFRRLADATLSLAELDAALASMGFMPAGKAGRPLETRVAGACRLFYRQAGAAALQLALLLAGASVAALAPGLPP
jgi:hypothetical protein